MKSKMTMQKFSSYKKQNNFKHLLFSTIWFVCISALCNAQQLTLENVIDSALIKNYSILIARNNSEIAASNNTFGMAGGLPNVGLSVSNNNSLYELHQKLNNGEKINNENIKSSVINGDLTASMMLFNGRKIIATKQKLDYLQQQNELKLNAEIQNTIAEIMISYYDIIRQQSYLNIIKNSNDVSQQKYEIIQKRFSVGMANAADLLQAKMDCNTTVQQIQGQQLVIDKAKNNLLQLMGSNRFYPFIINDSIQLSDAINRDSIFNIIEKNPEYLDAEIQLKINEQIAKEVQAQMYPSLSLNTGLSYSNANYSQGTYEYNRNYGPFIGASIHVPLFNGNINRHQKQNAEFNIKNAGLSRDNILTGLKTNALNTYQSYITTKQQIETQKSSFEDSKRLVAIVLERFKLNQATILDMKTASSSFENTGYLLVNLMFQAKVSEIELKRLMFKLQ